AHALETVDYQMHDGRVAITLVGDGWFAPKDFVLANPPRLVIDLPGVKNEVRQRAIAVKGDVVSRVRMSQFQTSPEMVTRVVIDLARPVAYAIAPDGERLAVLVGEGVSAAEIAPSAPAAPAEAQVAEAPAPASVSVHEAHVAASTTTIAEAPQSQELAQPEPAATAPTPLEYALAPATVQPESAPEPKPEPAPVAVAKSTPPPGLAPKVETVAAAPAPAAHPQT